MPFAQTELYPVTQLMMGLLFGEVPGRPTDFRRDPAWKRDRANPVRPRRCVFLPYSGESLLVQRICQPNNRRPESAMDVGNLSAHQTAHEDLIAISHGAGCPEDCASLLVSPPTAGYRLAGYGFGQSRSASMTSF
jgi:hypothetical protein